MTDSTSPQHGNAFIQRPSASAVLSMITLLIFIVLDFVVALVEPTFPHPLAALAAMLLIPLTFFLALVTYVNCVLRERFVLLVVLLALLSAAFLLALTLWFIFPEGNRLEPLATTFGVLLAFIGFLSSSSQIGVLELAFSEGKDGVHITVHVRAKDRNADADNAS